ncbi:MAG: exo-beta-N-acetylmuramidase NamZ family protein, partial [Streptosporangiales bacterium]
MADSTGRKVRRRHVLAGLAGAVAAPLAGSGVAAAATGSPTGRARGHQVRTGIEQLIANDYAAIRGQRVGLISNPTGILPDLRHELDVMHESGKVVVAAAFGPEHGFRGTKPPGGHDDYFVDPRTGVPVYNSYSAKNFAKVYRKEKLDAVLFDIQDVGARFYTYIWTMYRSMVGAALAGCRYVVLDRPNPITGLEALGPMLHPEYATAVGLKPISQQHGMTVGELAQLFNNEFLPDDAEGKKADLEVIQMRGWRRNYAYADTGLPWVLPSPNMPTVDTAWVYPGTC